MEYHELPTWREAGLRGVPRYRPFPERRPYRLTWIAFTPTGRQSKYWHDEEAAYPFTQSLFGLPKLRKGYEWHGPFRD